MSPERVDMGVDYGGSGPLYALGSGTISNLYNSGWPGGNFLTIHLDSGQYIYYAEDIAPLVAVGQKVTAGQHIANATGGSSGIEIGWAAPPGTGDALGASQFSGANSTAYGKLMSDLIHSLGGPAGIIQGAVSGSVPSSFGITAQGNTAASDQPAGASALGGVFSWAPEITSFFKEADTFTTTLGWILKPSSWVRIGAFFLAMILLVGAVIVFTRTDQKLGSVPKVMPVPV